MLQVIDVNQDNQLQGLRPEGRLLGSEQAAFLVVQASQKALSH